MLFLSAGRLDEQTGDILINEVAWGGTQASSADEWIELHNVTAAAVDLTGWRLVSADGSPDIALQGIIPSDGYFLLERSDDNTVSDVPADQIYTGTLSNSGETLYLYAPDGSLIDTANADGGAWPAGSGSPDYVSMSRLGLCADTPACWGTSGYNLGHDAAGNPIQGTPRAANFLSTPTPTAFASPTSTWTPTATLTPTFTPTPTATWTSTATLTSTFTPTPTATWTPTATPTLTFTPAPSPTPVSFTYGQVLINEVAWAGTSASSADEWLELHNASSTAVDLAGWRLTAADGQPDIALQGLIPPDGYFLLERSDDNTVSDRPADLIYTGSLSNNGEVLILYAPSGQEIDRLEAAAGWPAGSASPEYASMERSPSGLWLSFAGNIFLAHDAAGNPIHGTPGHENWANAVTPTPTPAATPVSTVTVTPAGSLTSSVVLNEINPRPGRDWNGDGWINRQDEYVEIINYGADPVSLKNWRLEIVVAGGRQDYRLPQLTLSPGETLPFYASLTGLFLPDNGATVRLLDARNHVADALTYTLVASRDQAWCRQSNLGHAWRYPCEPSPENAHHRAAAQTNKPSCTLPERTPMDFWVGECLFPSDGRPKLTDWAYQKRLTLSRWTSLVWLE